MTRESFGIHFDSENFQVYSTKNGLLCHIPSYLAVHRKSNRVIAIGHAAKELDGKSSPHLEIYTPFLHGTCAHEQYDEFFLRETLHQKIRTYQRLFSPFILSIPDVLSTIQRQAILHLYKKIGIHNLSLLPTTVSSLLGAGLFIEHPLPHGIFILTKHTASIGIVSMGCCVISKSISISQFHFINQVKEIILNQFQLHIGDKSAETLLNTYCFTNENFIGLQNCKGIDPNTSLPKSIKISIDSIHEIFHQYVQTLISFITSFIHEIDPIHHAHLFTEGLLFSGSGANRIGLLERLRKEIPIPFYFLPNPLFHTVRGAAYSPHYLEKYSFQL